MCAWTSGAASTHTAAAGTSSSRSRLGAHEHVELRHRVSAGDRCVISATRAPFDVVLAEPASQDLVDVEGLVGEHVARVRVRVPALLYVIHDPTAVGHEQAAHAQGRDRRSRAVNPRVRSTTRTSHSFMMTAWCDRYTRPSCPSGGMADTMDSKSIVRKGVWVRIPPRAQFRTDCRRRAGDPGSPFRVQALPRQSLSRSR